VVATPIWFAPLDGRLYAFSNENAGKVKRLRRSSDARIAVCDARGRRLGEWHPARARLVTDETLQRRAYASLRAKYGWRSLLLDFFSRLSGRIGHRVVLGIEPVESHPQAHPLGSLSPSLPEESRREH
jgi:PPOX class probable F420-dependent enzyme